MPAFAELNKHHWREREEIGNRQEAQAGGLEEVKKEVVNGCSERGHEGLGEREENMEDRVRWRQLICSGNP